MSIEKHPLEAKSREIVDSVFALCADLEKDEMSESYQPLLVEAATMIGAKVYSGLRTDSRLLALQNAAIIRYQGEFLLSSTSGMKDLTSANHDYLNVLRKEILEFQVLFIEWVQHIKTELENDMEDEWGLF